MMKHIKKSGHGSCIKNLISEKSFWNLSNDRMEENLEPSNGIKSFYFLTFFLVCVDILFKFLLDFYLLEETKTKLNNFQSHRKCQMLNLFINKLDIESLNAPQKSLYCLKVCLRCGCHFSQKKFFLRNLKPMPLKKVSTTILEFLSPY